MKTSVEMYQEQREDLLGRLIDTLARDDRFVAAWLTGSYGRGAADAVSDLDLNLVVSAAQSERLCLRLDQAMSNTSPERYALFSRFGTPALIHENNHNAPEGGTFTFVMYSDSAVMVDWILIPQGRAIRPSQSKLLFDKATISVSSPPQPENLEQSQKAVAEVWAFFWMMTAITIKYILRGNGVFAAHWLENLHGLVREVERHLNREPWQYSRGTLSSLQPTPEGQLASIRELCNQMLQRKGRVSEFIGSEPLTPIAEIETLLLLTQDMGQQSQIINRKSECPPST